MQKYRLGKDAMIASSLEIGTELAFYDNQPREYNRSDICLHVMAGENHIAVLMDTEQAKAIRRGLKMQIKAKTKKEKSYYQLTKEAAERI